MSSGFLTPYKSVCPQYVLPWSLLATIGSGPRSARTGATTLHAGTQRTTQLSFPMYPHTLSPKDPSGLKFNNFPSTCPTMCSTSIMSSPYKLASSDTSPLDSIVAYHTMPSR